MNHFLKKAVPKLSKYIIRETRETFTILAKKKKKKKKKKNARLTIYLGHAYRNSYKYLGHACRNSYKIFPEISAENRVSL